MGKIKSGLMALALGVSTILPLSAQSIKPFGNLEVAYTDRGNGYVFLGETEGKAQIGIERRVSDVGYSLSGTGEIYVDSAFEKIDYSQVGVQAKISYDNFELYGDYVHGGSSKNHDLTDTLSFGLKFKLGKEPNKDTALKLNTYGNLDIGYSPFRNEFNTSFKNEVRTAIDATAELDLRGFFLKAGGAFVSYESYLPDVDAFGPNIIKFQFWDSIGYQGLEVFHYHECDHAVTVANGQSWVNNIWQTSVPIAVDPGNGERPYFINQGAIDKIGVRVLW